eukprot:m.411463 g.411463  ORF g.411463 m.411463 type:complete len:161 (+) comp21248_c0_seq8:221-703(+)
MPSAGTRRRCHENVEHSITAPSSNHNPSSTSGAGEDTSQDELEESQKSPSAAKSIGILDILKKSHGKQLLALAAARCCLSGAVMFAQFSSGELLLQVFKGNHGNTQRVLTAVSTFTTLQMCIVGPVLGALMDSFGRRLSACLLKTSIRYRSVVCSFIQTP